MALITEVVADHVCLSAPCDGGHILGWLRLLNYRPGCVDLRSSP